MCMWLICLWVLALKNIERSVPDWRPSDRRDEPMPLANKEQNKVLQQTDVHWGFGSFFGVVLWFGSFVWNWYEGMKCKAWGRAEEKAHGDSQNGTEGVATCPRSPEVSLGFWSEHHDDVWCCQFWPRLKCEQPILLALSCQFLTHSTDHYPLSGVFFVCVCVSFANSVAPLHSSSRQTGTSLNRGWKDN